MAMTVIWTGMTALSLLCALALGNAGGLASAALDGAAQAIQLGISMAGVLCLWMGIMEVMDRAGLATKLAALLRPVLRRLFPDFSNDRGVMDTIASNVSANLLGLGNAATPLGLAAMKELEKENRRTPAASQAMVTFVVLNTASLQLLPTTNAYLRLAAGSKEPMEILPAVWLASSVSIGVGVLMTRLLAGWRKS